MQRSDYPSTTSCRTNIFAIFRNIFWNFSRYLKILVPRFFYETPQANLRNPGWETMQYVMTLLSVQNYRQILSC